MTLRLRSAALAALAVSLLGAAPAGAADFLYVAQRNGTDVSQFKLDSSGTPTAVANYTVGGSPWQIAVSQDQKSLYAALYDDNAVAQFDIDQATGALTPKSPATVPTGGLGTAGLVIAPDGNSLYASNRGDSTIAQFTVDAQGRLTPKSSPTIATGGMPERMVITPNGQNLCVTSRLSTNPGRVFQFSIDGSGQLSAKSPDNVAAGRAPEALALDATGTKLYVSYTHPGSGGPITIWNIDPSTGALNTSSSVSADANTGGMVFSQDYSHLFLTECNTDCSVFTFNRDLSGGLTFGSRTASMTVPGHPLDTLLSPGGNALYVSAGSKVALFDVASSGVLTPTPEPPAEPTPPAPTPTPVPPTPTPTPTATPDTPEGARISTKKGVTPTTQISRTGKAKIKLRCPDGEKCDIRGQLKISTSSKLARAAAAADGKRKIVGTLAIRTTFGSGAVRTVNQRVVLIFPRAPKQAPRPSFTG